MTTHHSSEQHRRNIAEQLTSLKAVSDADNVFNRHCNQHNTILRTKTGLTIRLSISWKRRKADHITQPHHSVTHSCIRSSVPSLIITQSDLHAFTHPLPSSIPHSPTPSPLFHHHPSSLANSLTHSPSLTHPSRRRHSRVQSHLNEI